MIPAEETFNGTWPFKPHFITSHGFKQHYVDEGPRDAEVVICLHGEPTWGYLYRNFIPELAKHYRVIVPDHMGFGKSETPADRTYTLQTHVENLTHLIEELDLNNITFVCQDWGGLIGLRLVAANPDRFARVVAANTFLPTGEVSPGEAFLAWRKFSQETPNFDSGRIVSGAVTCELGDDIIAAYNAPFPDDSFKAGPRQFPTLVPVSADAPQASENKEAWRRLSAFDKPFLTAFSDSDPITKNGERVFQELIKGCEGQKHTTIKDGGHFLQEDQGEQLAEVVVEFLKANPL